MNLFFKKSIFFIFVFNFFFFVFLLEHFFFSLFSLCSVWTTHFTLDAQTHGKERLHGKVTVLSPQPLKISDSPSTPPQPPPNKAKRDRRKRAEGQIFSATSQLDALTPRTIVGGSYSCPLPQLGGGKNA